MTKKELLENEAFMNAPDDAIIEIPNAAYREDFDEREEKTILTFSIGSSRIR